MQSIVHETQAVALLAFKGLDKLGIHRIAGVLTELATRASALTGIGRLFSQGLAKLRGAIDALLKWIGGKPLEIFQERAEQLWQDIQEGKCVSDLLDRVFALESTRQTLKTALSRPDLDGAALAAAAGEVVQLKVRFQENMGLFRRLCAGVAVAGDVLALSPIAAQSATALAGIYGLILAGVVLIGMDYADSSRVLNRVRGVGQIAAGLGVPASAAATSA